SLASGNPAGEKQESLGRGRGVRRWFDLSHGGSKATGRSAWRESLDKRGGRQRCRKGAASRLQLVFYNKFPPDRSVRKRPRLHGPPSHTHPGEHHRSHSPIIRSIDRMVGVTY